MTIIEFLEARITEDEAVARQPRGQQWTDGSFYTIASENDQCVLDIGHDGQYDWDGNVIEHIARHDPARVLAECAAKRAIINLADATLRENADRCDASALGAELMHDEVLCIIAAVYASHPDYKAEWAL